MTNGITLDENGLNAAITATALDDERMRAMGFTDHRPEVWFYSAPIAFDIFFHLTIPKDGNRLRIDVIDEEFGQPYDYQMLLRQKNPPPVAETARIAVEALLQMFTNVGVLHGWKPGMYV